MAELHEFGKLGIGQRAILLAIAGEVPLMRGRRRHVGHSGIGLPSVTERIRIFSQSQGIAPSASIAPVATG
jgi:hypothetical protein